MSRSNRLAGGLALVVVAGSGAFAQSRTAHLSVSAVVVSSCAVEAVGQSNGSRATSARVSLACSGRSARAVKLDVPARGSSVPPFVVDRHRLEFRVALRPGDSLVTLLF